MASCPDGTVLNKRTANGQDHLYCAMPDGTPHGKLQSMSGTTVVVEKTMNQGKRDGVMRSWHPSGRQQMYQVFESGVLRYGRQWHENGQLAASVKFDEQGKRHGRMVDFYENGRPSVEMGWDHGKKHGVWTHWNEDGTIERSEEWDKDQKVRVISETDARVAFFAENAAATARGLSLDQAVTHYVACDQGRREFPGKRACDATKRSEFVDSFCATNWAGARSAGADKLPLLTEEYCSWNFQWPHGFELASGEVFNVSVAECAEVMHGWCE